MIVDNILPQDYLTATTWVFLAILARLLFNRYGHGLNHIPGPWLASCTDLYRFCVVLGRRPEQWHIRLHEKYGKLVRIGPRCVSVGDVEAAKVIYALNSGFTKSGFYPVQQTIDPHGRPLHSLFNTTDEAFHARLRKAVSHAYAMSTLVQFQPFVDSTTTAFIAQLQRRFVDNDDGNATCDLGVWLQYYAFDVIGELTYSRRLGFVDRGEDVDRIIGDLEWLLDYVAPVGQMPFLDRLLLKNPLRLWLTKIGLLRSVSPVAAFARQRIAEVEAAAATADDKGKEQDSSDDHHPRQRDFLSRFQEAHQKDPAFITEQRVLALTVANLFAGSDTTAITLRTIFHQLLSQPAMLTRLLAELPDKKADSSSPLVTWDEARQMPYLGAVIKEALRWHPAAGLPLERVVPSNSATQQLCGGVGVPAGTVVGCSAWVLHRDESVFGARPGEFWPERWLVVQGQALAAMNNALFAFGAGARTCAGRNVALLEMYKLVPAVLRTFEMELVDPDTPLKIHNAWFVKQSGLRVRLKKRDPML